LFAKKAMRWGTLKKGASVGFLWVRGGRKNYGKPVWLVRKGKGGDLTGWAKEKQKKEEGDEYAKRQEDGDPLSRRA